MTYFCANCGEEESFAIKHYITEYAEEDELIDKEGENTDYDGHEVTDSETTDSDAPRCFSCNTEVSNYEEEELAEAKEDYKETHKEEIRKKKGVKNWKAEISNLSIPLEHD